MDAARSELAAALSQLLEAAASLDLTTLPSEERRTVVRAREAAAKALLKNRARSGRRWTTSPELASYFERWRVLRAHSPSL